MKILMIVLACVAIIALTTIITYSVMADTVIHWYENWVSQLGGYGG